MSRQSQTQARCKGMGPILFAVVFLGLQVSVAAFKLGAPRPASFSWQMFSGRPPGRVFWAVFSNGRQRKVNPIDYFGKTRPDMNLEDLVVDHVCGSLPNVLRVVVEREDGSSSKSHRCR